MYVAPFFMNASRCAVRLVVPIVMWLLSWFLVGDASADGPDGRNAACCR
jgi:hypothetical protein